MILTFLLSPLGRKVSLSAALVLALAYGYRQVTNHAYEQGRIEGGQQAWKLAEDNFQVRWAEERKRIDAEKAAAAAQTQEAQQARQAHTAHVAQTQQTIIETNTRFEEEHGAIAPAVTVALPEAPVVIQQELSIFQDQTRSLQANLANLQTLLNEERLTGAQELSASQAEFAVSQSELAQVTEERDFYKGAFAAVTTKKHCRLKKILTLGLGRCK